MDKKTKCMRNVLGEAGVGPGRGRGVAGARLGRGQGGAGAGSGRGRGVNGQRDVGPRWVSKKDARGERNCSPRASRF